MKEVATMEEPASVNNSEKVSTAARAIQAARLCKGTRQERTGLTRAEAALKFGIDDARITDAKQILTNGSPVLIAAVENDIIPLATGVRIARAVQPSAQGDAIAALLNGKKQGAHYATGLALGETYKPKKLPRHSHEKQMESILTSLDVTVDVLKRIATEATAHENRLAWAKRLRDIRTEIGRAVRAFEGGTEGGTDGQ